MFAADPVKYYAQQGGYDAGADASSYGPAASSSSYGAGSSSAASSQVQYDANGYRIHAGGTSTGGAGAPQLLDAELLQQSSVYVPGAEVPKTTGKAKTQVPVGRRDTVIRKAGGRVWEDATLVEWDPKWYRLFVGDVSNDVSERTLDDAFSKYPSYCKCKVVRDRLSQKAKYGFIAFKDPEDFLRAWKEMDGKYVGNRPIRLSKIKEDKYGGIDTTTISVRKAKELDKIRRNKGKPSNGRPVAW
ncbi:putative RNA-binding protein [Vanrija pseudolonga]|uniref:Purtative RNA-binding protein n=1 Tax=Vanrija pseudolonga TaxID=143232 RepID=A0AAF0Y2L3_9TREE|nr:purtative RNA-binding protein [Vanrija pseudolonga]